MGLATCRGRPAWRAASGAWVLLWRSVTQRRGEARGCGLGRDACRVLRPQPRLGAGFAERDGKRAGPVRIDRPHRPILEFPEVGVGGRAAQGLEQPKCDQLALDDKSRKFLHVFRIRRVVVNAVAVECERREAKQRDRIRQHRALPRRRRTKLGLALRLAGPAVCAARAERLHMNDILLLDHGQPASPEKAVAQRCDREVRVRGGANLDVGELAFAANSLTDHQRCMERDARPAEEAARHGNRRNEVVTAGQAVVAELRAMRRLQAEDGVPARRERLAGARGDIFATQRHGETLDQRRRDVILDDLARAD